ncbi:hypothetical protein GIB67_025511 [Kingdonia uniflora]|uniref:Uncharacterized protein n=1 Tax=Kingdonia uniflora TaxID=39325 RepID=A0A7J7PEN0_9MAGN|nr:hypothetical protein GIB67_025511 [Kingdonia uniflora]
MLTVERLRSHSTDIDYLRKNNSKVGCDGDSFTLTYLKEVLHFLPENIMEIPSEYSYPDALNNGSIAAAFLKLPYEKVFLSKYCKGFKVMGPTYRFGGLGFIFRKGSPFAADFSEAFLKLSENGNLTKLEDKWFKKSSKCSKQENNYKSLSLRSFWALFVLTGGTSSIAFLLYLIRLLKKYRRHQEEYGGNTTPRYESVWDRTRRLANFYQRDLIKHERLTPSNGFL